MNRLPTPIGRQREVLYLPATGHTVTLGTAGSGKTTLAILRAVDLQGQHCRPNEKTLLVTFNRMLVEYINSLGASLPDGLVVENYHKTARGFLNSRNLMLPNDIVEKDARLNLIASALEMENSTNPHTVLQRPREFFAEEFAWIARFGIRTLQEYEDAVRAGRKGARVVRASREIVWRVYQHYLALRTAS
ncbi:MAG TPA: DNA helicase, partial [Anaerolineae bacterium]